MALKHNFRELKIWQESMVLAKEMFQITKSLPSDERFGLISQMNRASVSIPSNIAEGTSRSSDKAFNQFLEIALGSAFELERQPVLAMEFEYINEKQLETMTTKIRELQKMISGFKSKLRPKSLVFLSSLFNF